MSPEPAPASRREPAEPSAAVAASRPAWASTDQLMADYYGNEWGVPVTSEEGIFEALSLEVFQSGLAWATILRKRPAFRAAFEGFQPDLVAAFTDQHVQRLMNDEGIVRNRRKILATIQNAGATVALRAAGGLSDYVWSFAPSTANAAPAQELSRTPESQALADGLRANGFTFVGPTTMHSFMQATGIVKVQKH